MEFMLGILMGVTNCVLMWACYMYGMRVQRYRSQTEVLRKARQIVDDMIFDSHRLGGK